MKKQKTQNSQFNIEGEEQIWTLSDFRTHYEAAVIKTVLAKGQSHRSVKQKRESRNRPFEIELTNFGKGAKAKQWISSALNKWCWNNWTSTCKNWTWTHRKRCPTSYIIRELQIKTVKCISVGMAKIPNTDTTRCQGHGPTGALSLLVGGQNGTASLEDTPAVSYKTRLFSALIHDMWDLCSPTSD